MADVTITYDRDFGDYSHNGGLIIDLEKFIADVLIQDKTIDFEMVQEFETFMTINTDKGILHLSKHKAEKLYLDYVNNFTTLAGFSEHYGMSSFSAHTLISKFRGE